MLVKLKAWFNELKVKHLIRCIILGILFNLFLIFFPFDNFTLQKDVSLVNFLSLILTAYIAIYVSRRFQKKQQIRTFVIQTFLDQINEILIILKEIECILESNRVSYFILVSSTQNIKLINNSIFEELGKSAWECDINTSIEELESSLVETPISSKIDEGIEIKDGVIIYKETRRTLINKNNQELRRKLFELKFFVIRKTS